MILKADKRKIESQSNLNSLREQGNIPAVVYGHDFDSKNIAVDKDDFVKVYRQAGRSEIFDLKLGKESYPVLIQSIQSDPVTDEVIHVDFYRIRSDEKIETKVPLLLEGEAPVTDKGGTIVSNLRELGVEALPKDLPSQITVDVSGLEEFEDEVRVKDLKIPDGVEIDYEPDDVVLSVARPATEEELEALEEKPEEIIEEIETVAEEEEEEEEEVEGEEAEPEEDLEDIDEELEAEEGQQQEKD